MMNVLLSLEESGLATWLRESQSVWALPTALTVHTLGLSLLVGSAWAVDLRLLGVARSIPMAPLATLFRVMWAGFWINTITGVLLFMTDATRKGVSTTFLVKMALVAAGVATMVFIKRQVYGSRGDAEVVPPPARVLAAVSILVWSAAITAGRLLAYVSEL